MPPQPSERLPQSAPAEAHVTWVGQPASPADPSPLLPSDDAPSWLASIGEASTPPSFDEAPVPAPPVPPVPVAPPVPVVLLVVLAPSPAPPVPAPPVPPLPMVPPFPPVPAPREVLDPLPPHAAVPKTIAVA
jgi:homeobox protein ESX1